MDRNEVLGSLRRTATRMGIRLRLRPLPGSPSGMELSFDWEGVPIRRTCSSGATRDQNAAALRGWLVALARNVERGIERVDEALRGDGVSMVIAGADTGVAPRQKSARRSRYEGEMTPAEAWQKVLRATRRLGLDEGDVRLTREADVAVLRLDLGGGRVVEKRSALQASVRQNAAALALWLEGRALVHERGIERDLGRAMAAYLLPEAA